jgi:hypothetical protein
VKKHQKRIAGLLGARNVTMKGGRNQGRSAMEDARMAAEPKEDFGRCDFCKGEAWYGDVIVSECAQHGNECPVIRESGGSIKRSLIVCGCCNDLVAIGSGKSAPARCPKEYPLIDVELTAVRLERVARGWAEVPRD